MSPLVACKWRCSVSIPFPDAVIQFPAPVGRWSRCSCCPPPPVSGHSLCVQIRGDQVRSISQQGSCDRSQLLYGTAPPTCSGIPWPTGGSSGAAWAQAASGVPSASRLRALQQLKFFSPREMNLLEQVLVLPIPPSVDPLQRPQRATSLLLALRGLCRVLGCLQGSGLQRAQWARGSPCPLRAKRRCPESAVVSV